MCDVQYISTIVQRLEKINLITDQRTKNNKAYV